MTRRSLNNVAAVKSSSSSIDRNVSFDKAGPKTFVVESKTNPQNADWYSPDEIKDFRKEGDSPIFESSVRKDFVRSLLHVQKEHKDMGIHDPKGLRQLSRAGSRESIKKAIERAQDIVNEPSSGVPKPPRRRLKNSPLVHGRKSLPDRDSLHDPNYS